MSNKQIINDAIRDANTISSVTEGNIDVQVTSRTGKKIWTLSTLSRMIEQGFYRMFSTTARLMAYRPEYSPFAAKALDTKKVYVWESNKWVDTGYSELELSIKYTDESNYFKSDFYDGKNDETDSYFVVDGFGVIATFLGGGVNKESDFFDDCNDKYETLVLGNEYSIFSEQMVSDIIFADFYDDNNNETLSLVVGYDGYIINRVESDGFGSTVPSNLIDSSSLRSEIYSEQGLVKKTYDLPYFYHMKDRNVISSSADLYGFYDNLMQESPEYVSKQDLGLDAVGNHLYSYTFTPPVKRIDSTERPYTNPIQLTIIAGIHGSERNAMIALMSFCHNLCNEFKYIENYGGFRSSIQLKIIPLLCPSGLNSGSRLNSNGVDLNRNFPTDWDDAAGPKGSSPLSELESQIASKFIQDNPDSMCNLSLHGHGLIQSWFWMATQKPWTLHLSNQVLDEMFEFYHSQMPFKTDPSITVTYLGDNTPGTLDRYIQKGLGKSSILLEFGTANDVVGNSILNARVLSETMIKKTVHKIKCVHDQSEILKSINI